MSKKEGLYISASAAKDGDGVFMSIKRHLEEMVENDEHERTVYPLKGVDKDTFFCSHIDIWQSFDRGTDYWNQRACGKECNGYEPRNGKNGICKHWRYTYEPDLDKPKPIHINEILNHDI